MSQQPCLSGPRCSLGGTLPLVEFLRVGAIFWSSCFKNHNHLNGVCVCVCFLAFNLANWCLLNTNRLSGSDNSAFFKQPQLAPAGERPGAWPPLFRSPSWDN